MWAYSALSQGIRLVVEHIPLVMWGCALAKWVGLYPASLALSRGIVGQGHSVSRPLLSQPIYAAIVCVSGGYSQSVLSGVFLMIYPVTFVNLSMLPLTLFPLYHSLSSLSEDLSPRTTPQD